MISMKKNSRFQFKNKFYRERERDLCTIKGVKYTLTLLFYFWETCSHMLLLLFFLAENYI